MTLRHRSSHQHLSWHCRHLCRLAPSVANDHAGILPCMSWQAGGNIFGIDLLRKLTKGKTVTGTMLEDGNKRDESS